MVVTRSVGDARYPAGAKCGAIPFELTRKPREPVLERGIQCCPLAVQCGLDARNGEQAGDARHPELAEHRAQLHRSPDAPELSCRVANDRGRTPEVLFEKV